VDVRGIVDDSLVQKVNDFPRDEIKQQGEALDLSFP
jgi:hypothetical protein